MYIICGLCRRDFEACRKGGLIKAALVGLTVPIELKSREDFDKLLEGASELRVVRYGDGAKVKLRTKDALYTFKTTSEDADAIVKGKKLPIVEF